jgi:hypothetical protein
MDTVSLIPLKLGQHRSMPAPLVAFAQFAIGLTTAPILSMSVSTSGAVRLQKGTASASTAEGSRGSVAKANGDGSSATVTGDRNKAFVKGDHSSVSAT